MKQKKVRSGVCDDSPTTVENGSQIPFLKR